MNSRATVRLAAGAIAALALTQAWAEGEIYSLEEIVQCGDVREATITDYRLRDATPMNKWNVADIGRNHHAPLMASMHAGEYNHFVMAHIDFMLIRWPNDSRALSALIEYDRNGGLPYEFLPPICYFIRAQQFVPDDVSVVLFQAYYFWKKGDNAKAKLSYEQAIKIDPKSPDAHYNLGLLYADQRDFEHAAEHARIAYSLGYPLPGLRRRLEREGYGDALSVAAAP